MTTDAYAVLETLRVQTRALLARYPTSTLLAAINPLEREVEVDEDERATTRRTAQASILMALIPPRTSETAQSLLSELFLDYRVNAQEFDILEVAGSETATLFVEMDLEGVAVTLVGADHPTNVLYHNDTVWPKDPLEIPDYTRAFVEAEAVLREGDLNAAVIIHFHPSCAKRSSDHEGMINPVWDLRFNLKKLFLHDSLTMICDDASGLEAVELLAIRDEQITEMGGKEIIEVLNTLIY